MHACKSEIGNCQPQSPRNGQHPERDQNEIRTGYKFAYFEAIEGQDRVYARIFLIGVPGVLKFLKKTRYTHEKRDWHECW